MGLEDFLGHFVTELTRSGVDHLIASSGSRRFCDHCNLLDERPVSLTLPCCGRVLCGPCTAKALVYRWETRCVVICEDCETAHTFEAPR